MAKRFKKYFREIYHALPLAVFFKQEVNTADQRSSQHPRQELIDDDDLQVALKPEIWACAKLATKPQTRCLWCQLRGDMPANPGIRKLRHYFA